MSGLVSSTVAGLLDLLLLSLLAWLLKKVQVVLLSRNPRLAALPLLILTGGAIVSEAVLAWVAQVTSLHFPSTAGLFAVPPAVMSGALFIQARPLWLAGIRGADVSVKKGIDYKRSLDLVRDHIDFLGTGAAKLSTEPNFEAALARCRTDRPLRFLLSLPDTENLERAARRFGRDREDYQKLVFASLRHLAELRERRALNLEIRFYSTPPIVRLIFIDDSICLASPNVYGEGDGSQLPQLHLVELRGKPSSRSFYHVFERYFNDLWSGGKTWDFKEYL
jgi:hypothetical protein